MIRKRPTSKKRGAIKAPKVAAPKINLSLGKVRKPRIRF
jgi:hypothetical protein